MQTFTLATALFAALAAATNKVTLKSLDSVDRTVYVTATAGTEGHDPVTVSAGSSVDIELPQGFIGNLYAVHSSATNTPGMLAEFAFQGWNGLTYFDVSAIVDATDVDNVSEIYPASDPSTPVSGCSSFPCNNAYYLPDDVQTKSSDQTHFVVTLSTNNAAASKRSAEDTSKNFARNFVVERL